MNLGKDRHMAVLYQTVIQMLPLFIPESRTPPLHHLQDGISRHKVVDGILQEPFDDNAIHARQQVKAAQFLYRKPFETMGKVQGFFHPLCHRQEFPPPHTVHPL